MSIVGWLWLAFVGSLFCDAGRQSAFGDTANLVAEEKRPWQKYCESFCLEVMLHSPKLVTQPRLKQYGGK